MATEREKRRRAKVREQVRNRGGHKARQIRELQAQLGKVEQGLVNLPVNAFTGELEIPSISLDEKQ